jgi:hypothetical protein
MNASSGEGHLVHLCRLIPPTSYDCEAPDGTVQEEVQGENRHQNATKKPRKR